MVSASEAWVVEDAEALCGGDSEAARRARS